MPIRIRSNLIMISPSIVADYANDAVASAGGVPVLGMYRTGSIIKVHVV